MRIRSLRSGSLAGSGRNWSTSASKTSSCLASFCRRPGSVSRMCVVSCSLSVRCRNGEPSLSAKCLESTYSYYKWRNKERPSPNRCCLIDIIREKERKNRVCAHRYAEWPRKNWRSFCIAARMSFRPSMSFCERFTTPM